MNTRLPFFVAVSAIACFLVTGLRPSAAVDPPDARPVEGLRQNSPDTHVLRGADLVQGPGRILESGTIVVRSGSIVDVGIDIPVPAGARIWDFAGKRIYAGFVDAYGEIDAKAPPADQGAPHWNDQVTPQVKVAEQYALDDDLNSDLRKQGITARLVAPSGGILKGQSALVLTGDQPNRRSILSDGVAQHIKLTVSNRGRDDFPNSPMGAVALARQFFYDVNWYTDVWRAYETDPTQTRPAVNDALHAMQQQLAGHLCIVDASNELFFLRADRFAREFGLNMIVRGSGREYRRLQAIRESGRSVIIPVDFPKAPNVGSIEAARNASLRELMHWDLAPSNAASLAQAGVQFAFTSHGLENRSDFLDSIRKAVIRGLPPERALAALTTEPAAMLGVASLLGTIDRGKLANLVVTDGELFAQETKVVETWVAGKRHEAKQADLHDARGTWALELNDGTALTLTLKGEPSSLSGKLQTVEETEIDLAQATLRGARFGCVFRSDKLGKEGVARLSAVLSKEKEQLAWSGAISWPDGTEVSFTAAVSEGQADEEGEGKEDAEEEAEEEEDEEALDASALAKVNFPLGAFGREAAPEQPALVAIRNATVWTCTDDGVLQNCTVLFGDGKVLAVGPDVEIPESAVVIDGTSKHITPGIVDCHSHMATDGGVNESSQAITAEVRVGDFIDANDVNIYRQLAGGVTTSNILHGSANPIGGQNQVIKLRWGSLPEEIKFHEAPQGIKFALGENVKQSNWGDDYTTRYPQTRMGVEQIMRDAFHAARFYQLRWRQWENEHRGLPPRRDLELDAMREILEGSRWVHCHSYRQDEILALIRTLDEFGVQIGTFQHILEGYKVADEMAAHGAMGSAFSDWWAYKFEVYDAIPYAGALMHEAGVVVSFNSDDRELARHLNQEAAKAVKYGGVSPEEALKFVTLNPARQLRIDEYIGSLAPGKHADLVVWSGPPLSTLTRCEQTWIDGRRYFELEEDQTLRAEGRELRNELIQKILTLKVPMKSESESDSEEAELWPREDVFCRCRKAQAN